MNADIVNPKPHVFEPCKGCIDYRRGDCHLRIGNCHICGMPESYEKHEAARPPATDAP